MSERFSRAERLKHRTLVGMFFAKGLPWEFKPVCLVGYLLTKPSDEREAAMRSTETSPRAG
jgi:hypothetical protein